MLPRDFMSSRWEKRKITADILVFSKLMIDAFPLSKKKNNGAATVQPGSRQRIAEGKHLARAQVSLKTIESSYWAQPAEEGISWMDATDEHGDIAVELADILEEYAGERPEETGWRYMDNPVDAKNTISKAIRDRVKKLSEFIGQLYESGDNAVEIAEISRRLEAYAVPIAKGKTKPWRRK